MTITEIDARLQKIWKEYELEPEVKERGFVFAEPKRAELLITGINPSWQGNEHKENSLETGARSRFGGDTHVFNENRYRQFVTLIFLNPPNSLYAQKVRDFIHSELIIFNLFTKIFVHLFF